MGFHSPEHARAVIQAIADVTKSSQIPDVIDHNFPAQKAFILDESKRKAAQCSRRGGKSNGVGRSQIYECFGYPGSIQLYIGLVRQTARNIMWDPILKRLNTKLALGGEPNESRLDMIFPNKSKIILLGGNANAEEMEKVLGMGLRSAVIDEAGSFRQDLRKLAYENLEPALADYDGWLGLTGTPTEITKGLFFDVANGKEPGWSVHKWMTQDNPYMVEFWTKRIAMLIAANPRIVETPAFRRMYLNEWVIDTDSLCYKYNSSVNDVEALPFKDKDQIHNVIGIDLGYNDATAFAVLCYGDHDKHCYIRHAEKKSGMIVSAVVKRIQQLIKKYEPVAIVIDNASKQAVEEMIQKYHLPLIAAEKAGKADFIEIMNSDLIIGNIKLLPGADDLKTEWGSLIWDKEALPKKQEHPSCENHLSDAALYGYRYCYSYLWEAREEVPSDEDKMDAWFDKQVEEYEKEERGEYWES